MILETITKTETKNTIGETVTVETSAIDTLKNYLLSFSPYERHPYYLDRLPTVSYIKNLDESSFKIEQQYGDIVKGENENKFPNQALKISEDAVKTFPDSYIAWKNLLSCEGLTPTRKAEVNYQLNRLDPLNPEHKLGS